MKIATKKRRWRAPTAKPGELLMRYGKLPGDEPELCMAWGEGTSKRDAILLHAVINSPRPRLDSKTPFSPSLVEELEARGYDITTLKFSIRKKEVQESSPV